jgi:large subunit ribosomal protein L13
MKTKSLRKEDAIAGRRWFEVDATQMVLGRLASEIAKILRGKHNVMVTPHIDSGDFVVVVNVEKVVLTSDKEDKKTYHKHTEHVGGLVTKTAAQLRESDPAALLSKAVWGMMPKGPLGRDMFSKLKLVVGPTHPHTAQKPEPLRFEHAGVR